MRIKKNIVLLIAVLCFQQAIANKGDSTVYAGNHKDLRYTGRVDYSMAAIPKFWASGVYFEAKFSGTYFILLVNDQFLYQEVHNYIEVKIDDQKSYRIQLKNIKNKIVLAEGLSKGSHTITVCKDTEAENGYIEVTGIICQQLLKAPAAKKRKIEFIGDSITCGFGSDESVITCDKGSWFDKHNAWKAYGPLTARALEADWMLSSSSGIGIVQSCCNKLITMPMIYDKTDISYSGPLWDFKKYQPDVVTICLGQNDGIQDSAKFCQGYIQFVKKIRAYYPKATLVFLTSPMAGSVLNTQLKKYTSSVAQYFSSNGDKNVGVYAFSKQSNKGCGGHPSLQEQQEMANELTAYLKKRMKW